MSFLFSNFVDFFPNKTHIVFYDDAVFIFLDCFFWRSKSNADQDGRPICKAKGLEHIDK